MQSIDIYKQGNDKLRLLLQGPAGSGKTQLACQFPGAYLIDVDVNGGGAIRYIREHGLKEPVGCDFLDRDEKGNVVPMKDRYTRLNTLLVAAQTNPVVETIIIDSATTFADVLIAEVLRVQNKDKMTKQEWGFFGNAGRHLFSVLTAMRKHIVFIGHEKINKNEDGSVAYPIKVAWPGQVGQNIGAFFTNVWRCEVERKMVPGPGGTLVAQYNWLVRTMPDQQYELKNTLGVPALFKFDWKIIEDALNKGCNTQPVSTAA